MSRFAVRIAPENGTLSAVTFYVDKSALPSFCEWVAKNGHSDGVLDALHRSGVWTSPDYRPRKDCTTGAA